MELIYLWVEDYKNIKNQGFNFSARFNCNYDENSNELTIEKNEDYINIFPKNINITAIVGENGSGKSSILEFLMDCFIMGYEDYSPNNFLLLYKYKNKFHLFYSGIHITNKEILKEFSIKEQNSFLLNKYGEQEGHDSIISLFINNEYTNTKIRYSNQFFIENSKKSLSEVNKLLIENSFKLKDSIPKFQNIFIPKKIGIKLDRIDDYTSIINKDRDFYNDQTWSKVTELSTQLKNSTFFKKINIIKDIFKIKRNSFKLVDEEKFDIFSRKKNKQYFQYEYKDFAETVPNVIQNNTNTDYEFILDINNLDIEVLTFIHNLPKEFIVELKDEERSFSNLSFGERQLLIQIHTTLKYLLEEFYYTYTHDQQGNEHEIKTTIEEIIIFLDEFEIGLHPNWQKKFIQYINELFKFTKKKIHIFITSHSPFLLSDIPKENIIFLEKGEQKNPFKEDKQTFGANIHTLLSHGFFMHDSLMGEFAKEKINDVIKLLKDDKKELSQDEIKFCKKIVSIIGEPILQRTLQGQLDMKLYPKETELEKLEREQKELQEKIDKIKEEQK